MLGLMQDQPLLISSLIEFAGLYHKDEEIVSRTVEGPIHRYSYQDCAARCRQLAKAISVQSVWQIFALLAACVFFADSSLV